MSSSSPKAYWKYLKSLNKHKSEKGPSMEEFYEHFRAASGSDGDDEDGVSNLPHVDDDFVPPNFNVDSLDRPITSTEIDRMISKCKNGKAPSNQDNIIYEYIKSTKHIMTPVYCSLFNKVLDSGILPDAWLIGTITPIFKNKGSSLNPQNYRPITLLSCLGKLFTSILNDRVTSFLSENSLLNENQAGFRANYSTCDHIFSLTVLIQKLRSERKKLFCAFIDFAAAFDSIWRAGLWQKLFKLGLRGKIVNVIHNMYSDIKSCVSVHGKTSPLFSSSSGVRQGENLSPILFSLYMNDLEEFLSTDSNGINLNITIDDAVYHLKLLVLLYADDTICFSDNLEDFKVNLDTFYQYCSMWKLNINYEKTKYIVFGSKGTKDFNCEINGNPIEHVKEYKYLGVLFSASGSFLNHKKYIISQANKAMHQMFFKINNLQLPIDLQLKLFDHTILPILTYGCEVWAYENTDLIEQFHCNFLRRITKAKKTTPRYMLYAELGRYPLEIVIKSRMISFWNKLILSKGTKISGLLYQLMLQSNTNYKWTSYIKAILDTTGHSYLWLNQKLISVKSIHKLIKHILIDQFKQTWFSQLQNSSRSKMYSLFKENTDLERYLITLPHSLRLTMLHFRLSNHRFPVEIGRWTQPRTPLHERKCSLCFSDIGDEMHYLLICPCFKDLRNKLIPKKYTVNPNIIKFKQIMTTSDPTRLRSLAIFMKHLIAAFAR